MARFLVYTSPARGHLYPLVPTLLELRRRGHLVHVRTLASEVEALRAAGLDARAIAPEIESVRLADWAAPTPEEGLAGVLRTFSDRSEWEIPDVQGAIVQVEPDVLLIDKTTAGAMAVAEASSLPWAQWIPFFEHFSMDPASRPDVTFIPYSLHPEGMSALNRPRLQLGLGPLDETTNPWRAHLYLYFTAEPFEHEGLGLPPHFRAVGPGIWEPAAQPQDWLEDVEQPIVLVTASSEYQRDDALVHSALDALSSEDVQVVVTTAAHDPGDFKVPANARIERWVSHGLILARAACVVCHGGMGITQKALAAGVPLCVVPFGRDQFEVAGRVVAVGAGTQVSPGELDPPTLRAAIRDAMLLRAGAQRIAEGFARAGGAPAAADELEGLLNERREGQRLVTNV